MQYFWDNLHHMQKAVKNGQPVKLFLDFDGTLSPLVTNPEHVRLPKRTKIILEKLHSLDKLHLTIVSGRALKDVKSRLNIDGISYSGNHGMEWEVEGRRSTVQIPSDTLQLLTVIRSKMLIISNNFQGTVVEDKTFSVAFHYRQAPLDKKSQIENILQTTFDAYLRTGLVSLLFCKDTYDIRANKNWTKGHIVKHLLKQSMHKDSSIIYIGDSETDEDAFKMLRDNITIKVGAPTDTMARYFLHDEKDVKKFLHWLFNTLK